MSNKKQGTDRYTAADFDVQSPGVGFDDTHEDDKKPTDASK